MNKFSSAIFSIGKNCTDVKFSLCSVQTMHCLLWSVFSPYDSICGISLLLFVLYHPRFLPIDFPWWKLVSSEHTFYPFYFSRKTMRTWRLHSTTWLKSFTIFTRRKLNRWRHWHRTFIFVLFSPWWEGRSIFSLHNFYLSRKAFLKIEVSTFLQLKGLILGFSFLRIFQPNLLKLVYLLLLFSHVKYWQVLVYV